MAWANGARADTGKGGDCNMGQGTANGRANRAASTGAGSRAAGGGGRCGAQASGTDVVSRCGAWVGMGIVGLSSGGRDGAPGTNSGGIGGGSRCGTWLGGMASGRAKGRDGGCSAGNLGVTQGTGTGNGGGLTAANSGTGSGSTGGVGIGAAGDGSLARANGARADMGKGGDCNTETNSADGSRVAEWRAGSGLDGTGNGSGHGTWLGKGSDGSGHGSRTNGGRGLGSGGTGGGEAAMGAGSSRAWRASEVSRTAVVGSRRPSSGAEGTEDGGNKAGRAAGVWAALRIRYKSCIASLNLLQSLGLSSVSQMVANVLQEASSV